MTSTPPGWYDDGHGAQRWWDGVRWTEHVQPPAAPVVVAAPQTVPEAVEVPAGVGSEEPAAVGYQAPGGAGVDVPAGIGSPAPAGGVSEVFPGYPATYPPAPPPPPKKSKLWVVWVVIGIFVLGLVITAIVVVPMVLGGLLSGGGAQPSDSDEQAALAAIDLWDDAWNEVDCDKFVEATTESLRVSYNAADCAAFEERAQLFAETTDDYEIEVNGIERDADSIVVSTTETYETSVDQNGETLDAPESVVEQWEYVVIPVDGGWAIDSTDTHTEQ